MLLLALDVGGTTTRVAVHDDAGDPRVAIARRDYKSQEHAGLVPILRSFLDEHGVSATRAGIAVAGPVTGRVCRATNLPWWIDADEIERELGLDAVHLINDFTAVALGIPRLSSDDVVVLQDGPVDPSGPLVILGAGTGLGEAVLVPTDSGPRVLASEGGHADFAPRDDVEIKLLEFLRTRHGRVSVERVVSGPGLFAIYEFVVAHGLAATTARLAEAVQTGSDPSAVIGEAALAGSDAAAVRAVEIFASVYGAEAGNLGLKILPTGGLFVAGGIAPKLLTILREPFLAGLRAKGRMSPLMESTRVAVVVDTDVGLLGASTAARSAR